MGSTIASAAAFRPASAAEADYFYYFAFGSNLLRERVTINSPTAVFVTTAKLEGYQLGFGSCHGRQPGNRWRGFPANICRIPPSASASPSAEPNAPPYVWGTVWRIHNDNLAALDAQEGVGIGYYEPVVVKTKPADEALGEEITCRSYEFVDKNPVRGPPSLIYKRVILAGARQNNLPSDYLAFLESVRDNGVDGEPDAEWLQPILRAIAKY